MRLSKNIMLLRAIVSRSEFYVELGETVYGKLLLRGVVTLKGKKSVICFLLSTDITHFSR